MKKTAILGATFLVSLAVTTAGCAGSGGSVDAGTSGDTSPGATCNATPVMDDAGLTKIGTTDPARSITLDVGGFYSIPSSSYKGYCFTYADTNGSAIYPPCGNTGPCFTVPTGLCLSANLGAGSATTWGGGFGCNLNQVKDTTTALYTDVTDKTNLIIGVYGCKIPDVLQVQLNVVDPPDTSSGVPGSGYFCKRVTLPSADSNGVRTATVKLTDLVEDCWQNTTPTLDPATMHVKSVQAQINATDGAASNWDFCVSQLSFQ
jgi:hypothetical protein